MTRMALLVGCNYPGTHDQLQGCHTDVQQMHQILIYMFGLNPNYIEVQIDNPGSTIMPTGANIMGALYRMVGQARQGDVLFFHFSGHGVIIPATNWHEQEEAIIPCDKNLITSVDFRHLVDQVPTGATFTILSDSCHSGGLIDKEPAQIGPQQYNVAPPYYSASVPYRNKMIPYETVLQQLSSMTRMNNPNIGEHLFQLFGPQASLMFRLPAHQFPRPLRPDQGILLSGCQPDEESQDGPAGRGGAFSHAVEMVLRENGGNLSNRNVIVLARHRLHRMGIYTQHPCLYCSNENANTIFLRHA